MVTAYYANDIHAGMGSSKEMIVEKLIRDLYTCINAPTYAQGVIQGALGYVPMTRMPVEGAG